MNAIAVKLEVGNAILDYLSQRPYREVAGLIKALESSENCQELIDNNLKKYKEAEAKVKADYLKKIQGKLIEGPGELSQLVDTAQVKELETPDEVAELTVD